MAPDHNTSLRSCSEQVNDNNSKFVGQGEMVVYSLREEHLSRKMQVVTQNKILQCRHIKQSYPHTHGFQNTHIRPYTKHMQKLEFLANFSSILKLLARFALHASSLLLVKVW